MRGKPVEQQLNLLTEDQLKEIETISGKLILADKLKDRDPGYHPDNLKAGVMAAPDSAEALSELLAYCNAQKIPVVPQGGLTGLVGGSISKPGQLIISTANINKHIEIDPISNVAIVDAGVTLEELQNAAAQYNLSPGIDVPSRGSATIGGMSATNAGGIEAFRMGSMRDRILGSIFVRADGSIVDDLAFVLKNNTGYALTDLIVGSEGTLGIITRLSIRLVPLRPVAATAMFVFPTIELVLQVAEHLRRYFGSSLRATEVLWREFAEAVAKQHGRQFSDTGLGEGRFLLLAETEETSQGNDAERFLACLEELFEQGLVEDAVIAQNNSQREFFWLMREDSDVALRGFPYVHSFDISVPLVHLAEYAARIDEELHQLADDISVFIFGHIGDGNLHVMIGSQNPFSYESVENILYPGIQELGGAFSAEHGIGTEKKGGYKRFINAEKQAVMIAIKKAMDPNNILNPNKILDLS